MDYEYSAYPAESIMSGILARKNLEDAIEAARERAMLGLEEGQGLPEYLGGHLMRALVKPSAWKAMKRGEEPRKNVYIDRIEGAIKDFLSGIKGE